MHEEINKETNDLEHGEHKNHTQLRALTIELDHLKHKLNRTSNEPAEAIHYLECNLHKLTLALHPSMKPEPLDENFTPIY